MTKNQELLLESNMNTDRHYCNMADLNAVLVDCMGKKALLEELVILFKKNISEFMANTREHLKNNDVEGIGFTSHKIKSSLKMMRTQSLFQIAAQMDAVCKNEIDFVHLDFLFNQFLNEYPSVEKSIDEQLKML